MYKSLRYFSRSNNKGASFINLTLLHIMVYGYLWNVAPYYNKYIYFSKYLLNSNHIENLRAINPVRRWLFVRFDFFFSSTRSLLFSYLHSSFFVTWRDMPFFFRMIVQLFILSSPATNPRSLFSYLIHLNDNWRGLSDDYMISKCYFIGTRQVTVSLLREKNIFIRYNLIDSIV